MTVGTTPQPTANVYVDGFNFYYGCYRDPRRPRWRSYKWLDCGAYFALIFPNYQINRIRYFTAEVKPPPHDLAKFARQREYIRALTTTPHLSVHLGHYATNKKKRLRADPRFKKPVPLQPIQMVDVIEEEEKGSDVNFASYLLVDAFAGEYDIAVVVSNDSDLAEPIRLVRSQLGRQVLLLNPHEWVAPHLRGVADFYRTVRLGPIQACQFALTLTDADGTITKPSTW